MATVAEAHLRCGYCGSDLIAQSDPLNTDQANMALFCHACGAAPTVKAVILESAERALEADAYIRMKDSGESGPVFECPACGEEAYIDFEGGCALCGEGVQWENCMVCHSRIPLEDALAGFDEGVCSYCTPYRREGRLRPFAQLRLRELDIIARSSIWLRGSGFRATKELVWHARFPKAIWQRSRQR
jgi:hypothetical protein